MGRVVTKIKLTNQADKNHALAGLLEPGRVRTTEIEALVDTGATMLVLPADVVARLGLPHEGTRKIRYADGRVDAVPWVGAVRIEILGRAMTCDALVVAEGTTPLIGQIPLEGLDLVVDPKSREVSVNPASPDAPMMDAMCASIAEGRVSRPACPAAGARRSPSRPISGSKAAPSPCRLTTDSGVSTLVLTR
jgi:clan AA aspartic protease